MSTAVGVLSVGPGLPLAEGAAADVDHAERRGAHQMTLVSHGRGDRPANGPSRSPVTSASARYVAYSSDADNLVARDNNASADVFRYDARSDRTLLVSSAADDKQARGRSRLPAISSSGRYVAYQSDAGNLAGPREKRRTVDVFRYDVVTQRTVLVSRPGRRGQHYSGSRSASVSGDGRLVAYASASGSVTGHDTNRRSDVFVFDTATRTTRRVSVRTDGSQRSGGSHDPAVSADGRFLTYTYQPSRPARRQDSAIYRYSLASGKTVLVSRSSRGQRGNGDSSQASLSGDGRIIVYRSAADNLVRGDTNARRDIYVFDARTHRTKLASYAENSRSANGPSAAPVISRDGQHIAFQSAATNLTSERGGRQVNVYGQYLRVGETVLLSESSTASPPNGASTSPTISADSFGVAFQSAATNIVSGGARTLDIFLRTRA